MCGPRIVLTEAVGADGGADRRGRIDWAKGDGAVASQFHEGLPLPDVYYCSGLGNYPCDGARVLL